MIDLPPALFGCTIAFCAAEDDPSFEQFPPEYREFAHGLAERSKLGRWAAYRALQNYGAPSATIRNDSRGAPLWPKEIVGSIAHTKTAAVAIVGPAARYQGVGIDLEWLDRPLAEGLEDRIATPTERATFSGERVRELFVIKEATYKAVAPNVGRYFGFQAATVTPLPNSEYSIALTFTIDPSASEAPALRGYTLKHRGFLIGIVAYTSSPSVSPASKGSSQVAVAPGTDS